jgi:hypothetical protein
MVVAGGVIWFHEPAAIFSIELTGLLDGASSVVIVFTGPGISPDKGWT